MADKRKASRTRKKSAKPETAPENAPSAGVIDPNGDPAAEHFVRGLLTRGEAAKPDESGALPMGATHEIVEEKEGELPTVQRRRFSLR